MNLTPPPAPLIRDALHTQVAEQLRARLLDGSLAPGSKVNERALCEELGVSRTPLREAIRQLAAEGLLVVEARRGAFVPEHDPVSIRETFDVIAALEGLAAARAAQYIDADGLQRLEALQETMEAAFHAGDLPAYYQANAAVHDVISRYAGNAVLRQTWQQLNDRLHALRFRSNQDKMKWERALHEHREILAALRKRDADRLRSLLQHHIEKKRDAVIEQLKARPVKGAAGKNNPPA